MKFIPWILMIIITGCVTEGRFNDLEKSTCASELMQPTDRTRLAHFIKSARPNQELTWYKAGIVYQARSLGIYLDDNGQPCRHYQVKGRIDKAHQKLWPIVTVCRQHGSWNVS
jgi:hypothetical protein